MRFILARRVRFVGLSEVNDDPRAGAAELSVDAVADRWRVTTIKA